jgi:hypothetical protein
VCEKIFDASALEVFGAGEVKSGAAVDVLLVDVDILNKSKFLLFLNKSKYFVVKKESAKNILIVI